MHIQLAMQRHTSSNTEAHKTSNAEAHTTSNTEAHTTSNAEAHTTSNAEAHHQQMRKGNNGSFLGYLQVFPCNLNKDLDSTRKLVAKSMGK